MILRSTKSTAVCASLERMLASPAEQCRKHCVTGFSARHESKPSIRVTAVESSKEPTTTLELLEG